MTKSDLEKFFRNELTGPAREDVINFLANPGNELLVKQWLKENWDQINQFNAIRQQLQAGEQSFNTSEQHLNSGDQQDPDALKAWQEIQNRIHTMEQPAIAGSGIPSKRTLLINSRFRAVAAAAILLLIISSAGYFLYNKPGAAKPISKIDYSSPVDQIDIAPPAASKAVLTLANGQQIFLDSSGNGTLANQGNMQIVKTHDGEIVYKGYEASRVEYNTLTIPKGSKPLRVALADGSIVWLNAASSITYPTAFNGNERKVSITGEAYFEVAKMAAQPFVVTHDGVAIKVLGTHFNVNTYADETELKVTLLEGSVDVSNGERSTILQPGQQASLSANNTRVSDAVDLEEVMAWKNGQFFFGGTNIKTIMRQIEKYYDVEVQYQDEVPYEFVAKISRQVNVSEFLEKLELTGLVHFKIEGKKIVVSK